VQRVERTTVVAAPPAEVFAFVAELNNLPAWQSGIASARRTSEGPMGVGATALVIRNLMGQRIEAPLTVTAFEPPRRLTVESTVSGVHATATIEVAPHAQGATVTFAMEIRGTGFTAFMEPMIASAAAGDIETSLGRLVERFAAQDRGEDR